MFQAVLLLPSDDERVPADWHQSGAHAGGYLLLPVLRDDVILARKWMTATAVQRAVLPLETDHDRLHT
jgi:hypothetical protein